MRRGGDEANSRSVCPKSICNMEHDADQDKFVESQLQDLESEVPGAGLVDFYLMTLANTASHLSEWMNFRAIGEAGAELGNTAFYQYMRKCISRLIRTKAFRTND